jgi:hypothetical protein
MSPAGLPEIGHQLAGRAALTLVPTVQQLLLRHGALMVASKEDLKRILYEIREGAALTTREKKSWEVVFSLLTREGRLRLASPGVTGGVDEAVESLIRTGVEPGRPHVLSISAPHFTTYFAKEEQASVIINTNLEVTTLSALDATEAFVRVKSEASQDVITYGSSRERAWHELFSGLAAHAKRITIFDRFVFRTILERDRSGESEAEHLVWLLDHIDRVARAGTLVTIYGAVGYNGVHASAEQIAAAIANRWSGRSGNISSVELRVSSSSGLQHHDRHITFGDNLGFDAPSGFDRLKSAYVPAGGFSFSYKSKNVQIQALRDRESYTEQGHPSVVNVAI